MVNSSQNGGAQGHMGAAVSRPLIGVTTSEVRLAEHSDPLPQGDPPQREMALGMVYMRAIELAGGIPVVLPPLGHDAIAPTARAPRRRLPVGRPGHRPRTATARRRATRSSAPTEPELDGYELALAQLADARGMPVLGDLPRRADAQRRAAAARCTSTCRTGEGRSSTARAAGRVTTHSVRIEPGSASRG